MQNLLFILVGLGVGAFSGVFGLGGGIIMIPLLVYGLHFTQHQAQGTTLAMMVPPIGLLAAWTYYKAGHVDIRIAGLCALGFFIGGYFGGRYANQLPDFALRKVFGSILLLISLKMIIWR